MLLKEVHSTDCLPRYRHYFTAYPMGHITRYFKRDFIIKYNNGFFEPQEDASYNKIFAIVNKLTNTNLMSKYQWARESKANYDFIKSLWVGEQASQCWKNLLLLLQPLLR